MGIARFKQHRPVVQDHLEERREDGFQAPGIGQVVFQGVALINVFVAVQDFIEHLLQGRILRNRGPGVAHVLLGVNSLLFAKGDSFFHDSGVADTGLGVPHDPTHVLLKPHHEKVI